MKYNLTNVSALSVGFMSLVNMRVTLNETTYIKNSCIFYKYVKINHSNKWIKYYNVLSFQWETRTQEYYLYKELRP